jgi:hypothetical protein
MKKVESLGGTAGFPHRIPDFVDLHHSKVADDDMAVLDLARHRTLCKLDLSDTSISDSGLKYVAQINSLRYLLLNRTRVTDAGIAQLAALPHLERLELRGTAVTDAAIDDIARMKGLTWLDLQGTAITDSAVKKLRPALPRLHVFWWTAEGEDAQEQVGGKKKGTEE